MLGIVQDLADFLSAMAAILANTTQTINILWCSRTRRNGRQNLGRIQIIAKAHHHANQPSSYQANLTASPTPNGGNMAIICELGVKR